MLLWWKHLPPSLGVGYEIAKAEEYGKKIICFYKKESGKRISAMISGNKNIILKEYIRLEELFEFVGNILKNQL